MFVLPILWVMIEPTMNPPPPPKALSVNSDESDAPVTVLSYLQDLDPRFLPRASYYDANSVIYVQSSTAERHFIIRTIQIEE